MLRFFLHRQLFTRACPQESSSSVEAQTLLCLRKAQSKLTASLELHGGATSRVQTLLLFTTLQKTHTTCLTFLYLVLGFLTVSVPLSFKLLLSQVLPLLLPTLFLDQLLYLSRF